MIINEMRSRAELTRAFSKFMTPNEFASIWATSGEAQVDAISAVYRRYYWSKVNWDHNGVRDAYTRILDLLTTLESHQGPVRYREDGGDDTSWKISKSDARKIS